MSRNQGEACSFGERIRVERRSRSWTQTKLGGEAGVSRPTIARVERGDDVSTATLAKVAAALELTITLDIDTPPDLHD